MRVLGPVVMLLLMAAPGGSSAMAQDSAPGNPGPPSSEPTKAALWVAIDLRHKVVDAGDSVLYRTVVTNTDTAPSPPLSVAMNIINLDARGDVVDPEDWSPQRTQYVERLAPDESADLSWRVNAILGGDYMVYMVAIPRPDGAEATTVPAASPGIHLTIRPFARINPRGVLAYVVGTPLLLLLGMGLLFRYRRRSIDRVPEPTTAATPSL